MDKPTMLVCNTDDEDTWFYDTRSKLTDSLQHHVRGDGESSDAFIGMIESIEGIVEVWMRPYRLIVKKASLFTVKEVDDEVRKMLSSMEAANAQLRSSQVPVVD